MQIEELNSRLKIPRYVASRTFLVIATHVLDNPVLKGPNGIRTWVVPGRRMDLPEAAMDPNFAVPASLCPILVLWPEPRDGQPLTNANQQATLSVAIRLFVHTVDPLDCLDLYGQVEAACSPDTVGEGAALSYRLGQVSRWGGIDLAQPAVVRYPGTDGPIMLAEGSVATRYRVPSY